MSKLYTITVTIFIVAILAYVLSPLYNKNDSEPINSALDTLSTLPFFSETEATGDSLMAIQDSLAQKEIEDYKSELKKLFKYTFSIDSLYNNLKNELKYCSEKKLLKELFNEFSNALNYKTRSEKEYLQLHKLWVADANKEKDEEIQEYYSKYFYLFRWSNNYYYFNVWDTELRPGDLFKITGYRRYRRKQIQWQPGTLDIVVSKLDLDPQFKPKGYNVIHKGKRNLKDTGFDFEYKFEEPGIYKITLKSSICFRQFWVHVSWLDGIVKTDENKMLVYISSFRDTISPPYRVHIISEKGDLFTTETDHKGLLVLKHKLLSKKRNNSAMIAIEKNEQMAFLKGYIPKSQSDTVHVNYIYTDCPVYRPGKIVHFGGIVKMLENGNLVERRHIDSVEVRIDGPQRTQLYKKHFQ